MSRDHLWLPLLFLHGLALALFYPFSYQQDGGYHFLLAKWGWSYPEMLLDTWGRPLFTLLYSLPAQTGYLPARLLTVAVVCATGTFTWRIARRLGLDHPHLAYPFLILQPAVMLLAADTLTEPLFALGLAAAIDLHLRGRPVAAGLVVSFLPAVRPEGFPLGLFWGLLMIWGQPFRRWPRALVLATGLALWALAGWIFAGDALHLARTWPWSHTEAFGKIRASWYLWIGLTVAGPVLLPLAIGGGVREWRRGRRLLPLLALYVFAVHAILWQFGLFASAGYPRYFVCLAPVIAILAISGLGPLARPAILVPSLAFAWLFAAYTVDCHEQLWDNRRVREACSEVPASPRLYWSHAYAPVLLGMDPQKHGLHHSYPRERNLEAIRSAPPGSVAVWDTRHGVRGYGFGPEAFEAAGFVRVRTIPYVAQPAWARLRILGYGRPEEREIWILVKP